MRKEARYHLGVKIIKSRKTEEMGQGERQLEVDCK